MTVAKFPQRQPPDPTDVFTPRLEDGSRLRVPWPASIARGVKGRRYIGRITHDGHVYDCYGAVCSLPDCYCDAVAVPLGRPDAPRAPEPSYALAPAPKPHGKGER